MLRAIARITLMSTLLVAFGLAGGYVGYTQSSGMQVIYQPAAECEPPVHSAI